MPSNLHLRPLTLSDQGLELLAASARNEGFRFVDRLTEEWRCGTNSFSGSGEKLLGVFCNEQLVAVGGLNRDPYMTEMKVGRLRHLYVLPNHRRHGVARLLVATLLDGAEEYFDKIRLRTDSKAPGQFYEACGFQRSGDSDATHELHTGNPGSQFL